MAEEKKSCEEALARLEEVVARLERGELTLDESLGLYEEGIGLIRLCSEALEAAEAKVKILQSTPEGDTVAFDFKSDIVET